MSRVMSCLIGLMFCLSLKVPIAMAQVEMSASTIKGDLLSIQGDRYVVKDISGRLVYLQIDQHTRQERMVVLGEQIEADVTIGERVVALRPANEPMMKGAVR